MDNIRFEDKATSVTADSMAAVGALAADAKARVEGLATQTASMAGQVYPKAVTEMKSNCELWRRSRLRQVKYLNNIVEQDHRRIKRLTRPGLGFGGFWTARRTIAGIEAMAMIGKGQIQSISGNDIRAQSAFITELFEVAA
jgi:DDE domain